MSSPRPSASLRMICLAAALLLAPAAQAQTRAIPIGQYQLIQIDGRTDILRAADHKLERLDGRTLAPMWKRGLTSHDQPSLAKLRTKGHDPTSTLRYVRVFLTRCPDLNGDGKGDFVFGLDFEPDLVAVNGATGEVLWWHRNRPRPAELQVLGGGGFVLSEPLTHDVDGDGVPDLITGLICNEIFSRDPRGKQKPLRLPAEALVQAVSGRTGKPIWSSRLEGVRLTKPGLTTDFLDYHQALTMWKGKPAVLVITGDRAWTLGFADGKPVGPPVKLPGATIVNGPTRERPVTFDPDGTGELAVLVMKDGKKLRRPDGADVDHLLLTAFRATTGEKLWEAEHEGLGLGLRPGLAYGDNRSPCDWPVPFRVSTQRGDRREDLLLPFKQQRVASGLNIYRYWHGVARLDGRTGKTVWGRRILIDEDTNHDHQTIPRLIAGPDLTGDGCPEVFAAFGIIDPAQRNTTQRVERAGTPNHERLCLTALSGSDGGLLWQRQAPDGLNRSRFGGPVIAPLQWLRPGPNVRPQLVVSRVASFDDRSCFLWAVEPATGFFRASLQGLEWATVAETDGLIFAHVPSSWNPRRTPDTGQLVQWRPELQAGPDEGGKLPAADDSPNLQTLEGLPWQERALPWAESRWLVWEAGAVVFLALLVLLALLRRWRTSLVFLLLWLLASAGLSYWLLQSDSAAMDAEEHYSPANWYGIGSIVAAALAPITAVVALFGGGTKEEHPKDAGPAGA